MNIVNVKSKKKEEKSKMERFCTSLMSNRMRVISDVLELDRTATYQPGQGEINRSCLSTERRNTNLVPKCIGDGLICNTDIDSETDSKSDSIDSGFGDLEINSTEASPDISCKRRNGVSSKEERTSLCRHKRTELQVLAIPDPITNMIIHANWAACNQNQNHSQNQRQIRTTRNRNKRYKMKS